MRLHSVRGFIWLLAPLWTACATHSAEDAPPTGGARTGCAATPFDPSCSAHDEAADPPLTPSPTASSGPTSPNAATCRPWENPTLPANLPSLGGHDDLQKVPEGLMLVDPTGRPTSELRCDTNTVIFVHGWTQTGQATNFAMPEKWRAQGWNTFMFRWHRDSYDTGVIPIAASKRTPAVAHKLAVLISELRTRLGGSAYTGEIRLVGHSLGALVVSYAGNEAFVAAERGPRRIELLDPAYLIDVTPDDDQAAHADEDPRYSELGSILLGLARRDVRVVTYNSIVAKLFGQNDTWKVLNRQVMSNEWLGPLSVVDKHNMMIPYYFGSIARPPPLTTFGAFAFSASLPTTSIPRDAAKYSQKSGQRSVEIDDDTYQ